jgi:hypothetical protein
MLAMVVTYANACKLTEAEPRKYYLRKVVRKCSIKSESCTYNDDGDDNVFAHCLATVSLIGAQKDHKRNVYRYKLASHESYSTSVDLQAGDGNKEQTFVPKPG